MARDYHQHCGLARALDVIGERWTLLLVRELLLAPRRYGELLMPGLTTNLLAKRLKNMEAAGIIQKTELRGEARYELTERGAALEPVIMEVARWGGALLRKGPRKGDRLDPGWGLLSLKRRYLGGLSKVVELRVAADGAERVFELSGGPRLHVQERFSSGADVVLHTGLKGFIGLFMQGASVAALSASKTVSVEGNGAALDELLRALAPMPA